MNLPGVAALAANMVKESGIGAKKYFIDFNELFGVDLATAVMQSLSSGKPAVYTIDHNKWFSAIRGYIGDLTKNPNTDPMSETLWFVSDRGDGDTDTCQVATMEVLHGAGDVFFVNHVAGGSVLLAEGTTFARFDIALYVHSLIHDGTGVVNAELIATLDNATAEA